MDGEGGLGGGILNTDWRPKMSFLKSCNVQKLDVPRGIGSLQLVIYLRGTTSPCCRAKDTLGQDKQGAHIIYNSCLCLSYPSASLSRALQ